MPSVCIHGPLGESTWGHRGTDGADSAKNRRGRKMEVPPISRNQGILLRHVDDTGA